MRTLLAAIAAVAFTAQAQPPGYLLDDFDSTAKHAIPYFASRVHQQGQVNKPRGVHGAIAE